MAGLVIRGSDGSVKLTTEGRPLGKILKIITLTTLRGSAVEPGFAEGKGFAIPVYNPYGTTKWCTVNVNGSTYSWDVPSIGITVILGVM